MKKHIKIKKVFAAILSFVLIAVICIPGYAAQGEENELEPQLECSQMLYVPNVLQTKTNWCWAACMSSMIKYYTGVDRTCEQLVMEKYNDKLNVTLDILEVQSFLENNYHITSLYQSATYSTTSSSSNEDDYAPPFGIDTIMAQLNAGKPMIALWGIDLASGHFVIICGYNYNDITGEFLVTYMDPFDATKKTVSYESFCRGKVMVNGEEKDSRFDGVLYSLGMTS